MGPRDAARLQGTPASGRVQGGTARACRRAAREAAWPKTGTRPITKNGTLLSRRLRAKIPVQREILWQNGNYAPSTNNLPGSITEPT